ncbi:CHAD domain-containing protein [Fulvivirga sediminis]|uniref:CHAD domain-containing protein n=1 Tax=Fulvivirga sediminis TaxID=2803949 RepID=A0A937F3V1_9BACT|nr:CHAD domain-containing protein [Fulvivirga sediminis]MBL3655220.1 CHAD domain-containing protein [Fulvivirga sediminis]
MRLKISDTENFTMGIKHLINEELTSSYEAIEKVTTETRHETIHSLRKSFKRIRAILRLIREKIGKQEYKKQNTFYRDLGRQISDLRDSTSIIEVLDDLRIKHKKELETDAFELPLESLTYYRRQATKKQLDQEDKLSFIQSALYDKLIASEEWIPEIESFTDLSPSLRRVYKRGKEGLAKSIESKSPQDFHEWRKRAKYLRFEMEVLNRIWPKPMKAFAKELHDITDYLGTDHDLYLLTEKINNSDVQFKSTTEKSILMALIEHQRQQLQEYSILKGKKFYNFHSDQFIQLLENAWNLHQKRKKKDSLLKQVVLIHQ